MADPTAPQVTPVFGVPTAPSTAAPVKKRSGLDNTLGFLGDFLLSKLGMGTPYRDARRAEKINAARLADTQDPSQTFSQTGNFDPDLAAKLQEQAIDNRRQESQAQSLADLREQQEALKTQARHASYLGRAASIMQVGMGQAKPGKEAETYSTLRQLRLHSQELMSDPVLQQQFKERYPETWDPAIVSASIGEAVPVQAQWQQRLMRDRDAATDADRDATRDERIRHNKVTEGQGGQRIGIARSRAEIAGRPKPARAPRLTESDIASGLIDQRAAGKPLSAGQRARVNKYIHGTSRPKVGDIVTLDDGRKFRLTK